jgi:predicted methyltransferase
MPIPVNKVQRIFPIRIALVVGCLVLTILVLNTIVQGVQTLMRPEVVELERDQWQRPSDILETLNITAGNVVVDLGSGSGYFSLKLCSIVGRRGHVLAVDTQGLPLFFLWVAVLMQGRCNIKVIQGEVDHPHLSAGAADAGLVANTYHELTNLEPILEDLFHTLRSGGLSFANNRSCGD